MIETTQIPSSWERVPLNQISISRMGKTILAKELGAEGIPVYSANAGNEEWGYIECSEVTFGNNTLVISARGNIGAPKKPRHPIFVSTQTTIATTFFNSDLVWFCFYFLSSYNFGKHSSQTTIPMLRVSDVNQIEVPLPPLSEQHRIVAKIEELFSELDKGIENLKIAQAQLKVYRQALLKHAFEGKLTSVSSNVVWPQKALGDLLDFLTSGSRGWAQYYAAAGDLFIRAQNIKHDLLELDDIAFVSLPERTEGLRAQVKKGDLLITVTGANVTKSALVERDVGTAYVSQHVALCRPTAEVFPRFLYWFIVAEAAGRKQLSDMAYGAGKPGLNLENIRSVRVPLPGLPEQQRIVELIEGKLSEVDQLDQTLTTSLQQAEALRQSILKKAFSGQLVPQDPHDEPASKLLARIKADNMRHTEKSKKSISRGMQNE